jgi:hypothetical protein
MYTESQIYSKNLCGWTSEILAKSSDKGCPIWKFLFQPNWTKNKEMRAKCFLKRVISNKVNLFQIVVSCVHNNWFQPGVRKLLWMHWQHNEVGMGFGFSIRVMYACSQIKSPSVLWCPIVFSAMIYSRHWCMSSSACTAWVPLWHDQYLPASKAPQVSRHSPW